MLGSDTSKEAPAPLERPGARTQEDIAPMSDSTVLGNLYKRHRTKEPLVTYRERRDGSRAYYVQHAGTHLPAGSSLEEAKAKKAELGLAKARGEKPILRPKTTFSELAETWFEGKAPRLRAKTREQYRSALDLVLLPQFGKWKLGAIDADAVAKLIRDLERDGLGAIDPSREKRGLGRSSVDNYLLPLQAVLALAVRRRLIAVSPCDVLTADEKPQREEKAPPHEWTDEELAELLSASGRNAKKPEARYDYTPLLRLTAALGLRCGEVLGLQWQDFDKARAISTSAGSGFAVASTGHARRRQASAPSRYRLTSSSISSRSRCRAATRRNQTRSSRPGTASRSDTGT